LFQFAFLPSILLVFLNFRKYFKQEKLENNRIILKTIFLYTIYQVLFILPSSYFQLNLSPGEIFRQLLPRLYFLLIPFIYWFVLPGFKNIKVPVYLISYSAIILMLLSFYNFTINRYMLTSTGDLRLISGVAAMVFAYSLITSFSIFSHSKNNLLLIATSLIGLVFVNHRSAYLAIGVIFIFSLMLNIIGTQKIKMKFSRVAFSLIVILLILIPLSQIPLVKENFTSRITAVFDVEDPNARDRMMRWGLSFAYFLENPINGSKLENKYYADDVLLKEYYAPHNFIFEILSTQGLIGFLFVSILLYLILKLGFKNRKDSISYQMFLIMLFYLFYSLFNVTFLNSWNILILVFSSAMILHRNKQIQDANYL